MKKTIPELILSRIEESIEMLSPRLRLWAKSHIITPRRIELSDDSEGKTKSFYWFVTDDEDSSYRVAYDEDIGKFGLECTLKDGTQWFMGIYGTFKDAIEKM